VELKTLIAAGALANARKFGGQDYIGYHSLMALAPAYHMSQELPAERAALPVFKVLYRNTNRMQEEGGCEHEVLHAIEAGDISTADADGDHLQAAMRAADMTKAEQTFKAMMHAPTGEAFNHLQFAVQDEVDVHRVVLAWRAYALLDLTGKEQAHTMLRQSVRYCVNTEKNMANRGQKRSGIRTVLPKLLDEHKLAGKTPGTREADDAFVLKLSQTVYSATPDQAAGAVAAALAEGFSLEAIGEAISLASNQLVLTDPGRPKEWASGNKPMGSVHGDSVGVHASDSANAWRNIARVSNPRNAFASLIVGAYHTAGQAGRANPEMAPLAADLKPIETKDADELMMQADRAIREKDQVRAAALIHRYGELGHPARGAFDVLLKFAISEDGALHAEKYYRTVCEEFAATRPAFRWRQLTALARVTASEYGYAAPGFEEAKKLIGVG
jgi:hypothetical protein